MSNTAQRIQRAKAALKAQQDTRYQLQRRTSTAAITSVNRDTATGHIDGTAWATIDGVGDQLIFVGAGTGVAVGDLLRVENRGSSLAPDWTLIGKLATSAGAEGLVDVGRPLSTVTGLSLASAVYTPTAGNIRARLTATWTQIGTWEGVGSYRVQLRRDFDASITATTTPHDPDNATTSLSWSELEPGIAYSVRVQALGYGGSVGGWTSWSSTTTTADTTAPATPSGLAAEQVDERTLRATWTANTEPDLWYYEIGVGNDGSATFSAYPKKTGTTPQHLIATQPLAPRYFRVRAVDTSGNASAWTSWSGPHATVERPSLAGLVYLTPHAELIADLASGAGAMDVTAAVFDSGEFAHILTSDGATEEIVKVTSSASAIAGGHRYTISRAADGGTAQAFDAGTPAYTLGQRGYIYADSRDDGTHTGTPYLDIYAWDDPYTGTWANRELIARLGKLNGITDPDFGALSGFGIYTTRGVFKGQIQAQGGEITDRLTILTGGELTGGSDAWTLDDDGLLLDGGVSSLDSGSTIRWKDGATEILRLGAWYNGASLLGSGLRATTGDLLLRAGTSGVLANADGGLAVGYQSTPGGSWADRDITCRDLVASGDISTDGGTNAWDLAGYTATAPTATGYVTVTINGTAYKLIAAT